MTRLIRSKTLVSAIKNAPDPLFGLWYNLNLYRGCQHGCIYCDSRSKCYNLGDLDDIRVKENAIELLENELKSKKRRGTIGFGSMNDPYMPVENEFQLTRSALKFVWHYRFPVHIITKSNLVFRDMDLLRQIGQIYSAVSFTITTPYDKLSETIEPKAPVSSLRLETMAELSKNGIYTGVCLMPVLPWITDKPEDLYLLIENAKKSGAHYILIWLGMTLREGQREFYYHQLENHFAGLKQLYNQNFGNKYSCSINNTTEIWKNIKKQCEKLQLPMRMQFYHPPLVVQQSIF